ncbi:dNA protecting protein DprA [Ruminococcus sp. CAG:624]|jgi:DNA processing protein|nr:dNA protecting protein DprA [Ruminococcus sp. CAG:624]
MKSLSDECRKIVILLKDGELHADIIADKLSMDAGELMMNLTELEIDGFIEAKAGNIYKIK